jgi:hypothetical protein
MGACRDGGIVQLQDARQDARYERRGDRSAPDNYVLGHSVVDVPYQGLGHRGTAVLDLSTLSRFADSPTRRTDKRRNHQRLTSHADTEYRRVLALRDAPTAPALAKRRPISGSE